MPLYKQPCLKTVSVSDISAGNLIVGDVSLLVRRNSATMSDLVVPLREKTCRLKYVVKCSIVHLLKKYNL